MKKQIISLLLLISLSFQSTYPAFERIKKRFGGSIAQAKELLNVRENIRCLRRGDNCSKEKRALLRVVSALVAALVAAGVAVVGKRVLGLSPEHKELWNNMKFVTSNEDMLVVTDSAVMEATNLNDIRFQGFSLIGAFLQGRFEDVKKFPTAIAGNIPDFIKVVKGLAERGVQVTKKDWLLASDLAARLAYRGYLNARNLYFAVNDIYRGDETK